MELLFFALSVEGARGMLQEKGLAFRWKHVWICSLLFQPPYRCLQGKELAMCLCPRIDLPHAFFRFQFRVTRDPEGMGPDPKGGYSFLHPLLVPLHVQIWAVRAGCLKSHHSAFVHCSSWNHKKKAASLEPS